MLNIVYGALGAVLVLLLFAGGMCVGYKLHVKLAAQEQARVPKPETPEEAERRRLIADQRAFHTQMSYNADMAYGLIPANDFDTEDGDT